MPYKIHMKPKFPTLQSMQKIINTCKTLTKLDKHMSLKN